jgi:hypothetical protein
MDKHHEINGIQPGEGWADHYERWLASGSPAKLRLYPIDMATMESTMLEIDIPTIDPERLDELMPLVRDALERVLRDHQRHYASKRAD